MLNYEIGPKPIVNLTLNFRLKSESFHEFLRRIVGQKKRCSLVVGSIFAILFLYIYDVSVTLIQLEFLFLLLDDFLALFRSFLLLIQIIHQPVHYFLKKIVASLTSILILKLLMKLLISMHHF